MAHKQGHVSDADTPFRNKAIKAIGNVGKSIKKRQSDKHAHQDARVRSMESGGIKYAVTKNTKKTKSSSITGYQDGSIISAHSSIHPDSPKRRGMSYSKYQRKNKPEPLVVPTSKVGTGWARLGIDQSLTYGKDAKVLPSRTNPKGSTKKQKRIVKKVHKRRAKN